MQFVLGYTALQAGIRSLPFALTLGVLAQPATRLAARVGTKRVVTAGLAVTAGGLAPMATATAHTTRQREHCPSETRVERSSGTSRTCRVNRCPPDRLAGHAAIR